MLPLAESLWPRTGGDRGHRARISASGPEEGRLLWELAVLPYPDPAARRFHGLALSDDGALHVVAGGQPLCVEGAGSVRWSGSEPCFAPPVCLRGGHSLASVPGRFVVLDPQGIVVREVAVGFSRDDSNVAPCLTRDAEGAWVLISTSPQGEVHRLQGERWICLGDFGYDILPPAAFGDGSLAVAGYAGSGFCRVNLDGKRRWCAPFEEVDLLPVVATSQRSAVGALGDGCTRFFSPEGAPLGRYEQAAICSEHAEGWVALSDGLLALLTPDGAVRWQRELPYKRGWGGLQGIVDGRGHIYAPCAGGLRCFTGEGALLFATELPGGQPLALCPLGPGQLALLFADRVVAVG